MAMKKEPYVIKFTQWNPPAWYRNFTNSLPLMKSNVAYYTQIYKELKKYNAGITSEFRPGASISPGISIWFSTEEDATAFILRWL